MGQPERPASPSQYGIRPSGITGHDLVERTEQSLARYALHSSAAPDVSPEAAPAAESNEPCYATLWGALPFAELCRRTQRIVGSVLVQVHGMSNPLDVDDCLQAGYLKLWQRLQKEPNWLCDKPKRYIVQAVVLHSKSQRFSHQRHYRKIVYDAQPQAASTAPHIPQLETWLDLQQALSRVAAAVEDQPVLLQAFYSLITDATVEEVASASQYAAKTLYKHRPLVRRTLAHALVGYGQPPAEPGLVLAEDVPSREKVSQQLLTDTPLFAHNAAVDRHLTRLVRAARLPDRRYATGWQARQTLEDIIAHATVRRAAYAKAYQLGLEAEDVEDCIQQGCIRLWERLSQQPDLLVGKGPVWTGIYIAFSGNPKAFHRHYQRRQRFADPDFDWDAADERLALGGLDRLRSDWTQAVDEQLDIARFMGLMAAYYANDTRKLLALYALTTSVQVRHVAAIMGIHEKNYAAAVGNGVRQTVQERSRAFFALPPASDDPVVI